VVSKVGTEREYIMRDILIGAIIITLAIWWAVENPQTANKLVSNIEGAAATLVKVVSD
jgi:hypothetical protein